MSGVFGIRFGTININTIPEATLLENPEVVTMVNMVRNASVTLKQAKVRDIVRTIIDHSDPECGFIISAAKDNDGKFLYPDETVVQTLMFNSTNRFMDGVRRISAMFAAAYMIANIGGVVIAETTNLAELLKTRSTEELKMLLELPEAADAAVTDDRFSDNQIQILRFFFEKTHWTSHEDLQLLCKIDIVGLDPQYLAYMGYTTTAVLVRTIADKINTMTAGTEVPVICAPQLAYSPELHALELYVKYQVVGSIAELVTIGFEWVTGVLLDDAGNITMIEEQSRYSRGFTQDDLDNTDGTGAPDTGKSIIIAHDLGSTILNVEVRNNLGEVITPDHIVTMDANNTRIYFESEVPIPGEWFVLVDF